MGKRRISWEKLRQKGALKSTPGWHSCDKCGNSGMIQEYDWIYNRTAYYYCDCYYGKLAKEKEPCQKKN